MSFNISINEDLANRMSSQEIATYFTLKRFMNHKSKQCFPSVPTLAGLLKLAENTVRKYLRTLQDKGIIAIERRYRMVDGKRQNFSNLYTFLCEGVLQKKKKPTSKNGDEHIQTEQNELIDTETIKLDLVKKYGKEVVDKALIQMKVAIDKGTNVYHLKNYLRVVCSKIQAQDNITRGLGQLGSNKGSKVNVGAKKNYPQSNNLKGGWGSSSISQAANKYSNAQLEDIMLKKRLKYLISK